MTAPTAPERPADPQLLTELDGLLRGVRAVAAPPAALPGWRGRTAQEYAEAVHRLIDLLAAAEQVLVRARSAA